MDDKSTIYSASEIFQFAVQIEQNGLDFYTSLAGRIDNDEAKNIFTFLANEESKHKDFFQKYLSSIETYESRDQYPEEYFDWLKALVDNVVFNKERAEKEIPNLTDPVKAIEFAMRREVDSILYYHEVKKLVVDKEKDSIEEIIKEEKKHFATLSKLRDIFE
jgi:rubrerythrin